MTTNKGTGRLSPAALVSATGDALIYELQELLGSTYMITSGLDDMINAVGDGEASVSDLMDLARDVLGKHFHVTHEIMIENYGDALDRVDKAQS